MAEFDSVGTWETRFKKGGGHAAGRHNKQLVNTRLAEGGGKTIQKQ